MLYYTHRVSSNELSEWFQQLKEQVSIKKYSIQGFCDSAKISKVFFYSMQPNNVADKDAYVLLASVWGIYDTARAMGVEIAPPPVPSEFKTPESYQENTLEKHIN